MPDKLQQFLRSRAGAISALVLLAAVATFAAIRLAGALGTSQAGALSRDRLFVCSETGKSFRHQIEAGDTIPVRSPYSGENTGFEAEKCYWTVDGQIKQEPTAVLLNEYVGKPGPTVCPDCGRLVVRWNPRPRPEQTPPPTAAQLGVDAVASN